MSGSGFANDIMVAENVDFTGAFPPSGQVSADGQLLIGNDDFPNIRVGALTSPNATIAIGYSEPNITLDVADGGFIWSDVSGAFSPLAGNGYFITGTATGTLPASPSQGDTIKFFVDHASQVLTIDAPGTQIIRMGELVTSSGGTAVSTVRGDSVELVYRASNTCWCAVAGFTGTWTIS